MESARGKLPAWTHSCRSYSSHFTGVCLNFFIFLFSSCPQTFSRSVGARHRFVSEHHPAVNCPRSSLYFQETDTTTLPLFNSQADICRRSQMFLMFQLIGFFFLSGCLYVSEKDLFTFTLCPYKTSVFSVGSNTKFLIKPNAAQLKVFQLGALQNLTGMCRTGGDRAFIVLTGQTHRFNTC